MSLQFFPKLIFGGNYLLGESVVTLCFMLGAQWIYFTTLGNLFGRFLARSTSC